jgi:hypothetical protein
MAHRAMFNQARAIAIKRKIQRDREQSFMRDLPPRDHFTSEKPSSKRAKRRLRGKSKGKTA